MGIANKHLQRMHEDNLIERIAPGLYLHPNMMADEYYIAQYRCRKGVFSHETALYFHELSDRTPLRLIMTVPSGYNSRILQDNKYQFFYCKKSLWDLGIIKMKSPYGNEIVLYDIERTLCDCYRKKDKLDNDLCLSALKQYMKRSDKDFAKLLLYAERFGIRELIYQYMEALA